MSAGRQGHRLKSAPALQVVHHPADVTQASFARGVFLRTLAIAKFLFLPDLFQDRGATVSEIILLDIPGSIVETVTDQFAQQLAFPGLISARFPTCLSFAPLIPEPSVW